MKRSLHMKLVLIMLLLIISLMTVVGAFLISGVLSFYLNEFYNQMHDAFSNAGFVSDLRKEAAAEGDEYDCAYSMAQILKAYSGELGIGSGSRNYYILDGQTGGFLVSSDSGGEAPDLTPNIVTALGGEYGYSSDSTSSYMDVALPVSEGDKSFIIYIRDDKQAAKSLTNELYMIIIEALVIGLIISVMLSFLLSKTMVTSIERLTDAVRRVAGGDFSRKIEMQSSDEIGVLTETFNDMATQLSDTLEQNEAERSKLSTLFLHMTDGVLAFDSEGGIMHSNPAAMRMLGLKSDETYDYGKIFGGLMPFGELLKLKSPDYREAELKTSDRDLAVSLAPLPGDRAQRGVLSVIHDVTEQKRTEQLQREFVANVSHETRTPLTSIRSYAETLERGDVPPEMQKRFLNVIINESDRMTRIVQDLLTLSRFDAGSAEVKSEFFSFVTAVKNVRDAVALEAERRGHAFTLETEEGVPEICGDSARIEQVVMNIVSNAIKYTPDGGAIRLKVGARDGEVYLRVQDNGIGIPKQDISRVFERFYRVDKARSRESGGTGLGLAIANEIVGKHNGRLELESEPGRGTTVTVILPAGR